MCCGSSYWVDAWVRLYEGIKGPFAVGRPYPDVASPFACISYEVRQAVIAIGLDSLVIAYGCLALICISL